jgi:hypothetical protein
MIKQVEILAMLMHYIVMRSPGDTILLIQASAVFRQSIPHRPLIHHCQNFFRNWFRIHRQLELERSCGLRPREI